MTDQPGLDAALLTQAQHGERLAELGERLTSTASRLEELALLVQGMRGTQDDQGEILQGLEGVSEKLRALTKRFDQLFPAPKEDGSEFYNPEPTTRWWELDEADHQKHLDRLRKWVEKIYRPQFGHIATSLPPCWEDHPLILTVLDIISELQKVLYLQPIRTQGMLAGQAELVSRVLPQLASLMTDEGRNCQHAPTKWIGAAERRRGA